MHGWSVPPLEMWEESQGQAFTDAEVPFVYGSLWLELSFGLQIPVLSFRSDVSQADHSEGGMVSFPGCGTGVGRGPTSAAL